MSAVLVMDQHLNEIRDSDTYNRSQMRRAIQTRGDPTAEFPTSDGGESLRVLIVDDHRAAADTTSTLIGIWGHDVRRVYDGASGLALAGEFQPDVLLLDIVMPEISGIELARQIRRQTQFTSCFIIALSGRADSGCRSQCDEAGIDLFLIKPVAPSILKALLTWESGYVLMSRQRALTSEVDKTPPEPGMVHKSPGSRPLPGSNLLSTGAI